MLTPRQITAILITSCTLLILAAPLFANSQVDDQKVYKKLEIFSSVFDEIQNNYVQEINSDEVLDGAIRGLLSSLDPHSSYLSPDEFIEFQEETTGSFSGIGIEITTQDNILIIISPIDNTPAEKAGIKARDQILEIDGQKTSQIGVQQAIKQLRGKRGTKVTLSLKREGRSSPIKVTITRENIPIESVRFVRLPMNIIYSRISSFQANTSHDYLSELNRLKKEGTIKGLILDLRNNPGGLLNQAIGISDLFLTSGRIVYTKGRAEQQNMSFDAHDVGEKNNFPIVVLINGGSASASEIVAGALQDHKRAIILGTRSFGKGSVQNIIPLPNGAALRITTAKYYTPNNRSIQALGITPDVEVPNMLNAQPKKMGKSQLKEADLTHHFNATLGQNTAMAIPPTQKEKEALELIKQDNQIRSAFNILKSVDMYSTYKDSKAGGAKAVQ